MPRLVSVNVGLPRSVTWNGEPVLTAIGKEPVAGAVRLTRLNLEGDAQADPRYHGGPDKAVYVYPAEHYPFWERELSRPLPFGAFGENLTTEGLLEEEVRAGDLLGIGPVRLQVTRPRTPCFKLGIRMGSAAFPKRFARSGRSGFYLRVLEEGWVEAGQPVVRLGSDPTAPTIRALFGARPGQAPGGGNG